MNLGKRTLLLTALLAPCGLGSLSAAPHGGTYNGPEDTVPPGGGGAGGGAPGGIPLGPQGNGPGGTGPGPSDPGTGGSGPAFPGARGNGPSTGLDAVADARSSWSYWWEVNKGPYLALKGHLYSMLPATGSDDFWLGGGEREFGVDSEEPTAEQLENLVVPALLLALETDPSVDVRSGAMMALAKIGGNRGEDGSSDLTPRFTQLLDDASSEIRETAAVALGVLGDSSSGEVLAHLLLDDSRGRALVGKTSVGDRTRAFAAFGLGIYGRGSSDAALRTGIVQELAAVLSEGPLPTPDLEVACISAFGLVPLEPGLPREAEAEQEPGSAAPASLEDQVAFLFQLLEDERRPRVVRAHVPTALARLVASMPDSTDDARATVRERLLELVAPRSKAESEVVQGALLALGEFARADDTEVIAALRGVAENAAGDVERGFALVALGRAGGRSGGAGSEEGASEVTRTLLRTLSRGAQARKAWAALALGVQAHGRLAAGHTPSAEVPRALREALKDTSAPQMVGATAVGLGLTRDADSVNAMLEKLERVKDDEARGYLCVGLGLLGEKRATKTIQALVQRSEYRPLLIVQASVALGLLGDVGAVPRLIEMLERAQSLAGQAGIASALGTIGDARSLEPLVRFLNDDSKTASARSFAAVALGLAGDTAALPWNQDLRTGVQYRAVTVTLSGQTGTGVLDIL